jgi:hypothetical protein
MGTTFRWISLFVFATVLFTSCSPGAQYNRKLKKELASGVRHDSIFMGLYLGMPEKAFYAHCWKLNRQGLVRQGESNTTVRFEMKGNLKYPALMDFYPKFREGKIFEMPVRFVYSGWAPWNKEMSAEKLQKDVLSYYRKIYGKDFISVRHPQKGTAWIRIDGNRRITIVKEDDMHVWAIFTDLTASDSNALTGDPMEFKNRLQDNSSK